MVPEGMPIYFETPREIIAFSKLTAEDERSWRKRQRDADAANPKQAEERKKKAREGGEYDPESFRTRHRKMGFAYSSEHVEDLVTDIDSSEPGGGRKGVISGIGAYPDIAFTMTQYINGNLIPKEVLAITDANVAKWTRQLIHGGKPGYVKHRDAIKESAFSDLDAFMQRVAALLTHSEGDRTPASYVTGPQILKLIESGKMTWLEALDMPSFMEQKGKRGDLPSEKMEIEAQQEALMGYIDFGGGLFPQSMEKAVPANRRAEIEFETQLGTVPHYAGPAAAENESGQELLFEYFRRSHELAERFEREMEMDADGLASEMLDFWGLASSEADEKKPDPKEEDKSS
jgi:hypothetical protein